MAIDISIEGRVIHLVSRGSSSAEKVAEQLVELYESDEFPENPIMYWDMRESASLGERSGADMGMIADKTNSYVGGLNIYSAFLVSSDLYHGMVRMMTAYGAAEDSTVRIFRNEEDAFKWLDELQSNDGKSSS